MKKTLLTLMLASMLAFTTNSQTLQNTYWRMYDINNALQAYVYLGQDTFYVSPDNVIYDSIATFTTVGNLFTIIDMPFWQCPQSDTGRYTFLIQADTLRFTTISDPCMSRNSVLAFGYLVQLPTGIEDLNSISTAIVYPNPSADGIFNVMFNDYGSLPERIYVLNVDGRKILDETVSSGAINHIINLQSFSSGIYFLVMENEKGKKVMKLVR